MRDLLDRVSNTFYGSNISPSRLTFLMALVFVFAQPSNAQSSPGIESFSPQGSVKQVRQVRAKFKTDMVALGDPRSKVDPFDVECSKKEPFTTRWADTQNWILDFNRDLPGGISCTFKKKEVLKDNAGNVISGYPVSSFKFSTGGPAITSIEPGSYSELANDQAFILRLDGPANEASIIKGAYLTVTGINERIGTQVITGPQREAILNAQLGRQWSGQEKEQSAQYVVIQGVRAFPDGATVTLNWTPGVLSKDGSPVVEAQAFEWKVNGPFEATFSCSRENASSGCNPALRTTLSFSSTITRELAEKITLTSSDKKVWRPSNLEKGNKERVHTLHFEGPFPERKEFVVSIPKNITDEQSRRLVNESKFPLKVKTESYSPLVKFPSSFGLLELKADPIMPLTVRNVEADLSVEQNSFEAKHLALTANSNLMDIVKWITKVSSKADNYDERGKSIFDSKSTKKFTIKKPGGPRAFEVIGIPLPTPGLHIVEVQSPILGAALLGKKAPMYVASAALVTDLSVHFKWGNKNGIVWVTELSSAKPVNDAKISIRNCNGVEMASGTTDANGVAKLGELPARAKVPSCNDIEGSAGTGLYAFAKKGEDLSFVHSNWNDGIEPWRFSVSYDSESEAWGPSIGHTIFDRKLYRVGETVYMKHILREHRMSGFGPIEASRKPLKAILRHSGSGQAQEFPITWDANAGVAEQKWTIPQEAKLGTYSISLSTKPLKATKSSVDQTADEEYSYGNSDEISMGSFRVEAFRVPLMAAVVKLPAEPLVRASSATVDISVRYLAGGGARNLPISLRHQVEENSAWMSFEAFSDYSFANGPVKEGRITRSNSYEDESDEDQATSIKEGKIDSRQLKLDATGSSRVEISALPAVQLPSRLTTEIEYTDANGEIQNASASTVLLPSAALIGLKTEAWMIMKKPIPVTAAVVGPNGKPIAGAPVEITAFQVTNFSHRKRLVGGFYAYESYSETKRLGPDTLCKGVTDASGRFSCEAKAPAAGSLIIQAKTQDASGSPSYTKRSIMVSEGEDMWMEQSESDRIDLVPEKKRYEPGETARIQVKVPFKESTVLVTVEREGVIDSFVQTLSREKPWIDVPMKGNYAPNAYVSVFAVRGRVGETKPTALIDLGRPSYKMGLVKLDIGWGAHELKVKVSTDKDVYRVREKAKVTVQVMRGPAAGTSALPATAEIAIAAVDEGLLELQPNTSWSLLKEMMGERPLNVRSSTAQSYVIGKRHFGLKAKAPGGDGGARSARELFDTLLLWKGRVPLNAKGEAEIEVPLNDSLTSFKIVAVAQAGQDLFGTGDKSIRATKELMLFSGAAPVVRHGDRVQVAFTVRNASEKPMTAAVEAFVKGTTLKPVTSSLPLSPGESKVVTLDVTVPQGVESLEYGVKASAGGGIEDSLIAKSKVIPAVPERVLQSTILQLEKSTTIPIERPVDAVSGRGSVTLITQSKLGRGLDGVKRYMREYPYTCMEQTLSRGIALEDKELLKKAVEMMSTYLDSEGFLKYFPSSELGSPTLTAYALSISNEAGLKLIPSAQSAMLTAMEKFVTGSATRTSFRADDLTARKVAALEAISRYAPVTDSLLQSIQPTHNVWATSVLLDWLSVLKRSPNLAKRDEYLKVADQALRTRLNFQGSTMGFSTEKTDGLWWLMTSVDLNSVRLLGLAVDDPAWKSDIPRLVRGALLRQRRGHWDLTTANAWGTLAYKKFSLAFEKDPIQGKTRFSIGSKQEFADWSKNPEGSVNKLTWPEGKSNLQISQEGTGRPWVTAQAIAAVPLKAPLSSGYRIRRTIEPLEAKVKGKYSVGDIIRVKIEVDAQTDQTWVVISDPVPAGATILGSGLGGGTKLIKKASTPEAKSWPEFEERGFDSFKSYFGVVYKGKFDAEYTMRLNSSGRMLLPTTRVEAMYAPEMFGEVPNEAMDIQP